jgi:hypothetical protein
MLATYHTTTDEVSKKLINDIKQRFRRGEKLTITVASDGHAGTSNKVLEFLEIEKKFPLKSVPQNLNFDDVINNINL